VPHAAASLPEVADGEAHVLEARGLELHLLEQLLRQTLVLVALAGQPSQFLKATGKPVTGALELIEAQQRGALALAVLARGCRRCRDEREAVGEDRRELSLEPTDLGAQRAPCLALALCSHAGARLLRWAIKNQLPRSGHTRSPPCFAQTRF
jgi:hypothetical protein